MSQRQGYQSGYVVGDYYDASGPISVQKFESLDGYAKTIVQENGFFRQPETVVNAIRVWNVSGYDFDICLDELNPRRLSPNEEERFTQVERNAFPLPHGQAGHFVVGHCGYILHICEKVKGENGATKRLTPCGYSYQELTNCTLVVEDDPEISYRYMVRKATNTELNSRTMIKNDASTDICLYISLAATAYTPTEQEELLLKASRLNDNGPEILYKDELLSGGRAFVKLPQRRWALRAVTKVDTRITPFEPISRAASMDAYNDNADTYAYNGQVVVALRGSNGSGIVLKTYSDEDVKKARASLVISKNNGI